MNNSNNFNVCEKCGTANPLIAKYCYQCGAHLRTPEDPIVCNNCNTVNSGSARYCKHCGTRLFRGATVKICPRCNHTVNGDAYICERCGFEFVAMRQTVQNVPQLPQAAGMTAAAQTEQQRPSKKELRRLQSQPLPQQNLYNPAQPYRQPNMQQQFVCSPAAVAQAGGYTEVKSGGVRVAGLLIMLLSLAFMYLFVGYYKIMPASWVGVEAISYVGINYAGSAFVSGGEFLWMFVEAAKANALGSLSVGVYFLGVLASMFVISAFAMFLYGLVKLCNGRTSKSASSWCIFMFIFGAVMVALLAMVMLINGSFFERIRTLFFGDGIAVKGGGMLFYSPVFFFVLFLFSLGVRRKKIRE